MRDKPPFFPQGTDYSCVPACLRSILAHYGIEKSEEELIQACKCDQGTTVDNLVAAAHALGFSGTEADFSDWDGLRHHLMNGSFPIVWIRVRSEPAMVNPPLHAVVVTSHGKRVVMLNPASGPDYVLSEKEFRHAWDQADNLIVVVRREARP
ncbi:MAG TPA: cysteine peptidase family C39 domain-containing protein [Blastocatellia bacterium]|nr:cysteine peptidase family C39 domain-containing protein [Blastocatellia bacterium]